MDFLDPGSPASSGSELRSRRETARLSLRALADRGNFSASHLSRVETDQRPVTAAVIRLYATLGLKKADPATHRPPGPFPPRPQDAAGLEIGCFGAEMLRQRIAKGKSLTELKAELYLSRPQLWRIERGLTRGTYERAVALDAALGAHGTLVERFRQTCACAGPVAPDTSILSPRVPVVPDARCPDLTERAATAAARLHELRIRSHQAGPRSVLVHLGNGIAELYNLAGGVPDTANPLWPVILRYAELLGWTAQEAGHDAIAMRWTRALADWAAYLGDVDALGYAWIRQSQWARRNGDAGAAVALAGKARALGGISPRLAQVAAGREAQACALAGDESAYGWALEQFHELATASSQAGFSDALLPGWGPAPDPAFDRSGLLEATCLVDFKDFRTAMELFSEGMKCLGAARTGYARLAVRHGIACAHADEPEYACQIVRGALPTVICQGSASLLADLKQLKKVLNQYSRSPAVQSLLPDLVTALCAARSRTGRPDTDES